MRIFDHYQYNLADRVKKKDTLALVERMLSELGLRHENLSFTISLIMKGFDELTNQFPNLKKYLYYYEPFRSEVLTSLTPRWEDGEIYAEKEDWETLFEIFSKVPHRYNLSGELIFQGIDWYGAGSSKGIGEETDKGSCNGIGEETSAGIGELAFRETVDAGKASICDLRGAVSNSVIIHRSFSEGNRLNKVELYVDATSQDVPRDTRDLMLQDVPRDTRDLTAKLSPYLGEPESWQRECFFTKEESGCLAAYRKEAAAELEKQAAEFASAFKENYAGHFGDAFVPALVDKQMIRKVFKNTDFEVLPKKKGDLSGMNVLQCLDRHHFQYELLIDRTPNCPTFFYFYLEVKGCNFMIRSGQNVLLAASREEAEERLGELARFAARWKESFGEFLAQRFGDTPEWYWL